MELIERAGFLATIQEKFEKVSEGEGHCILLSGEAGIGKTSLVKAFCKEQKKNIKFYQGSCDALFAPRPLAPLYDIAWQLKSDLSENDSNIADRTGLFTRLFNELANQEELSVVILEDIHWADEATLDFIKFLARRITRIRCLFILTYRDNEIHSRHPLRTVLGQLPPDSFTRINLPPLSRQAVESMAKEKGYNGEDVYSISGGNPFYVSEILASYSPGIPDNVKDSVLSVFNMLDKKTKQVWETLSVIPAGFELKYLEIIEPSYPDAIENCLALKILLPVNGLIYFKHELFRRTIESSLSPLLRVELNKKILNLFLESFEKSRQIERIIHHAKNANEYELVVKYAPLAAKQAAAMGAHIEAAKLYFTAIEYYKGNDEDVLIQLYEPYAYECYLTNRIKDAIIYQEKSLEIWKEKNEIEKIGNSLWFLSRLWWFEGKRKQAENYAKQAVKMLKDQPVSKAKAMAFINMAQLKMYADKMEECIGWGEKASEYAKELGDEEILAHALNSMGSALMSKLSTSHNGIDLLKQSLEISLRNSYHELAARAYTALGSNAFSLGDYVFAKENLETGINYCEGRDLDSLKSCMLGWKAKLALETGLWHEAFRIADNLLKDKNLVPLIRIVAITVWATIKFRRGEHDLLPLLMDAKEMAFETLELQRIIPVLSAWLEYEWITQERWLEPGEIDKALTMLEEAKMHSKANRLYYWLSKARQEYRVAKGAIEQKENGSFQTARKEAAHWRKLGCPYDEALGLLEGNDEDKRKGISIVHGLGANAVYGRLKMEMRNSGIKSIPRGARKTTLANHAHLTERELDVLRLLKDGMQNKEIASRLYISPKTVDHHISSILFKLDVNTRSKAVKEAIYQQIIK